MARFRQVNKGRSNAHHDALAFPDGKTVLLTQLCKGQHATVLQLPVTSPVTANEAQRHGSLVGAQASGRLSQGLLGRLNDDLPQAG